MTFALDTETTGTDFWHGAAPFFLTICYADGTQYYWDWDVDPLTRNPVVPSGDVTEIRQHIDRARNWATFSEDVRDRHSVVMQNGKFDVHALTRLGITDYPWVVHEDTLVAAHVLASNRRHNLTALAVRYLGVDISPYEKKLEQAVQECRRWCRTNRPAWLIASDEIPHLLPSAKGSKSSKKGGEKDRLWQYDLWLPKAVAKERGESPDHPYWRVLREYSNVDPAVTLACWRVMEGELKRRGLWKIYKERLKVLPVASEMEERGVTMNGLRHQEVETHCLRESARLGSICQTIAKRHSYPLSLPGGGRSKNLDEFCFDVLKLPVLERTESGGPAMTKAVLEQWEKTIPPTSRGHAFVKALRTKRSHDTALTFLKAYARFWLPLRKVNRFTLEYEQQREDDWYRLHPNLNPTGTDTLRWSCNNPNEQNIKKGEEGLRSCFGPAPGREWWSLDAKNIERRMPAYEAGETEIIALFERPDDPPYFGSEHSLVAHVLFPTLFDACLTCRKCNREVRPSGATGTQEYCECSTPNPFVDGRVFKKRYAAGPYQWVKNGNFAIQYGAQKKKADETYRCPGAYDKIKGRFYRQEELNQRLIRFANKHGYVETIPDRNVDPKRGYPLWCSRVSDGTVLPTLPLNYRSSGSAMWWTARAMTQTHSLLRKWRASSGFNGFIALQVHDELVLDFPKSRVHPKESEVKSNLWRVREVQRVMEACGTGIGIPTPVGIEYNEYHWGIGVSF